MKMQKLIVLFALVAIALFTPSVSQAQLTPKGVETSLALKVHAP